MWKSACVGVYQLLNIHCSVCNLWRLLQHVRISSLIPYLTQDKWNDSSTGGNVWLFTEENMLMWNHTITPNIFWVKWLITEHLGIISNVLFKNTLTEMEHSQISSMPGHISVQDPSFFPLYVTFNLYVM